MFSALPALYYMYTDKDSNLISDYIQMVSTHTMEYINAATSGKLSPHVLTVIDLQRMLQHIADTLPPILHLPISPEDTLHLYRYCVLMS